jgi:hypothetical protein
LVNNTITGTARKNLAAYREALREAIDNGT